jgi:hypothetical protein
MSNDNRSSVSGGLNDRDITYFSFKYTESGGLTARYLLKQQADSISLYDSNGNFSDAEAYLKLY